jgi:hypothetical protein
MLWVLRMPVDVYAYIVRSDWKPWPFGGLVEGVDGDAIEMTDLVAPGTCERLFTQSEFREAVADAIGFAASDSTRDRVVRLRDAYVANPCESTWESLAGAVGLEGENQ